LSNNSKAIKQFQGFAACHIAKLRDGPVSFLAKAVACEVWSLTGQLNAESEQRLSNCLGCLQNQHPMFTMHLESQLVGGYLDKLDRIMDIEEQKLLASEDFRAMIHHERSGGLYEQLRAYKISERSLVH
jgi:hypothetical protein